MNIIDSTLFKLRDIEELEPVNHLSNMVDIMVDDDESFCFADGTISHNSALGMGINVRDPKIHGFYGLRGKVKNTHNLSNIEVLKNKELSELVSIIGLDLTTDQLTDELNYGKLCILTDADHDGNAIACLLFRFFTRWEDLFEHKRIYRVVTPLYIARKPKQKTRYYYTQSEYEKDASNLRGWEVDYIKGLGSLEQDDYAETIIKNPKLYQIKLDDITMLDMAFSKDTQKRKEWLMGDVSDEV